MLRTGVFVGLLAVSVAACVSPDPGLSDDDLISRFDRNRMDYERIVSLAYDRSPELREVRREGASTLATDPDGLEADRVAEIERLMLKLDLTRVSFAPSERGRLAVFPVLESGLGVSGQSVSINYGEIVSGCEHVDDVRAALRAAAETGRNGTFCRSIRDGWYLRGSG